MKRLMVAVFILSVLLISISFAAAQLCTDTDNGLDYLTKATLTMPSGKEYTDFCVSTSWSGKKVPTSKYVYEYYCMNQNFGATVIKKCANTCTDGACDAVQICEEKKSRDGTTAVNYGIKSLNSFSGVTYNKGKTYCEGNVLVQYSCKDEKLVKTKVETCAYGCNYGKCNQTPVLKSFCQEYVLFNGTKMINYSLYPFYNNDSSIFIAVPQFKCSNGWTFDEGYTNYTNLFHYYCNPLNNSFGLNITNCQSTFCSNFKGNDQCVSCDYLPLNATCQNNVFTNISKNYCTNTITQTQWNCSDINLPLSYKCTTELSPKTKSYVGCKAVCQESTTNMTCNYFKSNGALQYKEYSCKINDYTGILGWIYQKNANGCYVNNVCKQKIDTVWITGGICEYSAYTMNLKTGWICTNIDDSLIKAYPASFGSGYSSNYNTHPKCGTSEFTVSTTDTVSYYHICDSNGIFMNMTKKCTNGCGIIGTCME